MTNNSGDMTNNISDERLKELIKTNDKESRFGRNGYYADIGNALAELLSARQTIADKDKLIERLAENSKALAEVMREEWNERSRRLWAHDELLAELEGKG